MPSILLRKCLTTRSLVDESEWVALENFSDSSSNDFMVAPAPLQLNLHREVEAMKWKMQRNMEVREMGGEVRAEAERESERNKGMMLTVELRDGDEAEVLLINEQTGKLEWVSKEEWKL